MPSLDRRLCGVLLFTLILGVGCTPRYVAPQPHEPHAVLKTRFVHHAAPGPMLALQLWVGDAVILRDRTPVSRGVVPPPHTRAFRVHPGPAAVRAESSFFHTVSRMVTRQVQEQYACGTQQSGFGTQRSTTTRYCTRTRTQSQMQTDTVVDGACRVGGAFHAHAGRTYVLQYEYYAHERCTAQVLEQIAAPDGSFQLVPVPEIAPPPS
jgi:hypothetical protein